MDYPERKQVGLLLLPEHRNLSLGWFLVYSLSRSLIAVPLRSVTSRAQGGERKRERRRRREKNSPVEPPSSFLDCVSSRAAVSWTCSGWRMEGVLLYVLLMMTEKTYICTDIFLLKLLSNWRLVYIKGNENDYCLLLCFASVFLKDPRSFIVLQDCSVNRKKMNIVHKLHQYWRKRSCQRSSLKISKQSASETQRYINCNIYIHRDISILYIHWTKVWKRPYLWRKSEHTKKFKGNTGTTYCRWLWKFCRWIFWSRNLISKRTAIYFSADVSYAEWHHDDSGVRTTWPAGPESSKNLKWKKYPPPT